MTHSDQISPIAFHPGTPCDAALFPEGEWNVARVRTLFELPLVDLTYRAQQVHREHHAPDAVQLSTLLSIKTGGCPEDCGYCSQSARHEGAVPAGNLLAIDDVLQAARAAKAGGATRFCMGAAWRSPKDRDLGAVSRMIREVKALGLETCVTLGMLEEHQAYALKDAGLDYYNHNLDTSAEFYPQIVSTRRHAERLATLGHARKAGLRLCCGGIVGLGESREDRASLIAQLAALSPYPESVPVNGLMRMPGTPLEHAAPLDPFEIVRTVAAARITMPKAVVRLTAGRQGMDDALQALCFFAGANSIFVGERLLTAENPQLERDHALLSRLGMRPVT